MNWEREVRHGRQFGGKPEWDVIRGGLMKQKSTKDWGKMKSADLMRKGYRKC